ncbi:MAG: hypothetical protein ACJ76Z_05230 [Thermoleophilaceae bacterium]
MSPKGDIGALVDPDFSSDFAIYRVGVRGKTLLDRGSAIDPESLSLEGSTLYWVDGGVRRSAALDD